MFAGILRVLGFLPAILTGVEGLFGAKNGQQKQSAALSMVGLMLGGIEGLSGKDIVDNDAFQDGLKKVIDGTIQCLNASVWHKKAV
jgi:hypothetical protein